MNRTLRTLQLRTITRTAAGAFTAGVLALSLVACQQATLEPSPNDPALTEMADERIEPERIAALSYESAELIAELGLDDRLVIMPEAVMNEALGSHQHLLDDVATTYAVEKELTAETVIDAEPDLVIMSPRHGAEETIGDVLAAAGIETLVTSNSWSTPEDLVENIQRIGEAVGATDEAEQLATGLSQGLEARASVTEHAPRVLILSNQAGRAFVTAGKAFPVEVVRLAGGANVSDELGLTTTGPIQVEQVLAADPDGIILIDMNGTGDRLFADLLENDGVRGLDAVAHDRVLRVQGKDVQALGLTNTVSGLDRIAEWVATLP